MIVELDPVDFDVVQTGYNIPSPFSQCSGILAGLCLRADSLSFGPSSGVQAINTNSLNYLGRLAPGFSADGSVGRYTFREYDYSYWWDVGDRRYTIGRSNVAVEYTLTSYAISAVPVPAAGGTLLGALALLGFGLRRRPR